LAKIGLAKVILNLIKTFEKVPDLTSKFTNKKEAPVA